MKTKVKQYREELGLSQEELARKSGISRTVISGLENDTIKSTTNTTMEKICNVLNKTVIEVFFS